MSELFRSEQYVNQLPDHLGKNKSVILIGPSDYLQKERKGALIDSFDTIARIKGGFHMTTQPEIYGSKTSVMFQDALDKWCDFEKVHKLHQFQNVIYVYPPFIQHDDTLIRTHAITNYFERKSPLFLKSPELFSSTAQKPNP